MPIHPAYPPEPRQGDGCVGGVIYAVLFLAGMIIFYAFFLDPIHDAIVAYGWTATPCTIVSSKVEPVMDKEKSRDKGAAAIVGYRPEIKYDYRVAGQRRRSERIWFIRPQPDNQADAKKVVDRYPAVSQQQCYVNPKDVDFAVLERGFRAELLIALIPLLLALVGVTGMVSRVMRRMGRREPQFRPLHHFAAGASITHHAKSGVMALIVVIFLCAVWNGIVSFLVREVISNWREGLPGCHGIFLTLFAIPFVLVGLFLAVLPFYLFLKLFNPRPTLTLAPAETPIGGSVELSWRFSGRHDRIHRLRISLEGREEATYGSGDDTATAREVFMTVAIIDTSKQAEIRSGKTRITVPAKAIPTFVAPHNRIAWAIRLCGEIRKWPDVDEEFEFIVLPAMQAQTQTAGAVA
ncbi:MAG TPA: DUF3592 domain-containing protein [Tepidisphaeraceae bacterium]|nr:DUF3592 domain-containing protein [Tepidisphaeraceae bacterium]